MALLLWCVFQFEEVLQIVFPIWMGATVTPTDPGLQGHFFYQYAFFNLTVAVANTVGLWVMRKATASPNNSRNKNKDSSDREKSEGVPGGSFTFTMEELNGHSPPTTDAV